MTMRERQIQEGCGRLDHATVSLIFAENDVVNIKRVGQDGSDHLNSLAVEPNNNAISEQLPHRPLIDIPSFPFPIHEVVFQRVENGFLICFKNSENNEQIIIEISKIQILDNTIISVEYKFTIGEAVITLTNTLDASHPELFQNGLIPAIQLEWMKYFYQASPFLNDFGEIIYSVSGGISNDTVYDDFLRRPELMDIISKIENLIRQNFDQQKRENNLNINIDDFKDFLRRNNVPESIIGDLAKYIILISLLIDFENEQQFIQDMFIFLNDSQYLLFLRQHAEFSRYLDLIRQYVNSISEETKTDDRTTETSQVDYEEELTDYDLSLTPLVVAIIANTLRPISKELLPVMMTNKIALGNTGLIELLKTQVDVANYFSNIRIQIVQRTIDAPKNDAKTEIEDSANEGNLDLKQIYEFMVEWYEKLQTNIYIAFLTATLEIENPNLEATKKSIIDFINFILNILSQWVMRVAIEEDVSKLN